MHLRVNDASDECQVAGRPAVPPVGSATLTLDIGGAGTPTFRLISHFLTKR